jgi:hypothetical protein
VYNRLWNDLVQQYGGSLQTERAPWKLYKAQGAVEALSKIHNRMIELKEEKLEEKDER